MSFPVVATFFIMAVGYSVLLAVLLKKQIITLRPRVVSLIVAPVILVMFAFLVSQVGDSQVVRWLFDVGQEKNIPSLLSSLLLISVGVVGLWTSWQLIRTPSRWPLVAYWLLLGALFVLLGFDEYYLLHERLRSWHLIYAILGGGFAAATVIAAWFFDKPNLRLYALIILGLAAIGIGGIGFDWARSPIPFGYVFRFSVEEYLEYVGITLILLVVLTYLRQHSRPATWHWQVLVSVNIAWVLSSLFWTYWPLSWLEIENSVDKVSVEFLDGDLMLLGYQVGRDPSMPGHLKISEYWRTSKPLYANYAHAFKLLNLETNTVVAQANISINPDLPPTEGWIPGLIYKKVAYLPVDEVTPGHYSLALQIWQEPEAVITLPISATDLTLIEPDTVVLRGVTLPRETFD